SLSGAPRAGHHRGPRARAGAALLRLRDRRRSGARVAARSRLRRRAARLHPDARHTPGERGTGAPRAEPRRRVGPRELPGPAPVLHRGPAVRRRRPDRRRRPATGPRDDSPQGGRAMTAQQHDPELSGPARLTAPRVPVVRLNRRVLYVVGGTLVVVVLAGLVALHAPASPPAQAHTSPASRLPAP